MVFFCTQFNAGFVKPTLYNISRIFCLMFLIDAIKPNVEKKFKTLRDCLGEGSRESM